MTIRYVGPGGSDAANGLSWANRKLTLTGVEDSPVAAGDIVYVAPGTYREQLTCDVSGTTDTWITYIADTTGKVTDGVGGIVRVTGTDDETTYTRTVCFNVATRSYRKFVGFTLGEVTTACIWITSGNYTVVEDCFFGQGYDTGQYGIQISSNTSPTGYEFRRCTFMGLRGIYFGLVTPTKNITNTIIENCIFLGCYYTIYGVYAGGFLVTNCTFIGSYYAVRCNPGSATYPITVYNCNMVSAYYQFNAAASGEIVEDYNNRGYSGSADLNNTAGANDTSYPSSLLAPWMPYYGFRIPQAQAGELAPWSALGHIAEHSGTNEDFYGIGRPGSAKNSCGAFQVRDFSRSTTQTYGSSTASLKLADVGEVHFQVPLTSGVEVTVSARVYREANYSGANPAVYIDMPNGGGASASDTGSSGQWNLVSFTYTPSQTGVAIVRLMSFNSATSGSYAVYFDDLKVQ